MKEYRNPDYEKNIINDIHNILYCVIEPAIYRDVLPCKITYAHSCEPIPFEERKSLVYKEIKEGESWGGLFDCAWFHIEAKLEEKLENLFLAIDINGEGLLYSKSGYPLKGFTNGSSVFDRGLGEPKKQYYPLNKITKNKNIDVYLDAGCNDLFGSLQENGIVKFVKIVQKDIKVEEVFYDMEVLLSLVKTLDKSDKHYQMFFDGLVEIRNLYWYNRTSAYQKAKEIINRLFAIKSRSKYNITAVGHAHIDLAWLWPIRETKRKVVRTISNILYLLGKYPKFTFVISQPQQLVFLKEISEDLWNKVRFYEKKGRIELVGGMFVESDTNITGEESLVRQMLHGQKYYLENFGHYVNNLWLPDVFGYNGNLPQIIKKSGQDYFVTTKISWCTVNQFPYHSFMWEGIDGTKVLTHLPPEGTYNSAALPTSIHKAVSNLTPDDHYDKALLVYGIGNGGGGPGDEHVNRLEREKSLYKTPKTRMGRVDEFFEDFVKHQNEVETYKGELYLENHQGTYTSQANNKRYNRLLEEKLKKVEWVLENIGIDKEKELLPIWERVLLYQFHDILPGSSIRRVYEESIQDYKSIENELDNILCDAIKEYSKEFSEGDYLVNHLAYPVTKLIKKENAYYEFKLDPMGFTNNFTLFNEENFDRLTTKYFDISFDETGYINKLIDLRNNKTILNYGNKLRVFRDHGDAWNIMDHYREQDEVFFELRKHSVKKFGSIYEISNEYQFMDSSIKEIVIIDDSDIIKFYHKTNFQNVGYMVHSVFDFTFSTKIARCDIQYGHLERKRDNLTSITRAQFEVCAQNWVDVSKADFGVSLFNNAKYGHYIKDNKLELNLVRSTNYPCTNGDIGETEYSFALYVHDKGFEDSEVDKLAYIFNSEFLVFEKPFALNKRIEISDKIEYSCFKKAYKKEGTIIRLYERNGEHVKSKIKLLWPHNKVMLVNMLEDEISELDLSSELEFTPFEVKTIWIY